MDRRELVLAALAPAKGESHSPVQVQKLMFLIDQELADELDGPHFNFRAYDYGPFDDMVYVELEQLEQEGLVDIEREWTWRTYKLTVEGQKEGNKILMKIDEEVRKYIRRLSAFVRSLSFSELVAAIYKSYPEMRENSVFQE